VAERKQKDVYSKDTMSAVEIICHRPHQYCKVLELLLKLLFSTHFNQKAPIDRNRQNCCASINNSHLANETIHHKQEIPTSGSRIPQAPVAQEEGDFAHLTCLGAEDFSGGAGTS
jgi:hypothetical protein